MAEPDKREKRRRAAIASILRRRKRSRKSRANPGTSETSWAEYGPVTFTPGSDRSWAQKFGLFVLLLVGLSIPVILVVAGMTGWLNDTISFFTQYNENLRYSASKGGFWGWLFPTVLFCFLVLSCAAIVFVSIVSLARIVKSNINPD